MTYLVRTSEYIKEDLERGWSSYNFGEDGITGSLDTVDEVIQKTLDADGVLMISETEIYFVDYEVKAFKQRQDGKWEHEFALKNDVGKEYRVRELYKDYWVYVDPEFEGSIAADRLPCDSLEEAIAIVEGEDRYTYNDMAEGEWLGDAELVYTSKDGVCHVFKQAY